MNTNRFSQRTAAGCFVCVALALITGCATSNQGESKNAGAASGQFPVKYRADDKRTVSIGSRSAADGGWKFKNPHMDQCWIADDFNFSGYDTVYIAPTLSTAKLHEDEERPHKLAMENIVIELNRSLAETGIFPNVVTREADIRPGARVLRMENTIVEYAKGGGGARYFVGLYGGGQPNLRVQGKMTDGDKTLFRYEARRSGVSAGARLSGAFLKDEDIQVEDIRSLALDLTDFMRAIAGKYPPKN